MPIAKGSGSGIFSGLLGRTPVGANQTASALSELSLPTSNLPDLFPGDIANELQPLSAELRTPAGDRFDLNSLQRPEPTETFQEGTPSSSPQIETADIQTKLKGDFGLSAASPKTDGYFENTTQGANFSPELASAELLISYSPVISASIIQEAPTNSSVVPTAVQAVSLLQQSFKVRSIDSEAALTSFSTDIDRPSADESRTSNTEATLLNHQLARQGRFPEDSTAVVREKPLAVQAMNPKDQLTEFSVSRQLERSPGVAIARTSEAPSAQSATAPLNIAEPRVGNLPADTLAEMEHVMAAQAQSDQLSAAPQKAEWSVAHMTGSTDHLSQASRLLLDVVRNETSWSNLASNPTLRTFEVARSDGTVLQTLKIQLTPMELGKVELKMKMQGGGMQIEVRVETDQVLQMLSADQSAILATIRGLGYKVDSVFLVNPQMNDQQAFSMTNRLDADGSRDDLQDQPQQNEGRFGNPRRDSRPNDHSHGGHQSGAGHEYI